MNRRGSLVGLLGVVVSSVAGCDTQPVAVASLTVATIDGRTVAPLVITDARAHVLIFITHDCPIANQYAPELVRLAADFAPAGIRFFLVHVDPDATPELLRRHAAEYSLTGCEIVFDAEHRLVDQLGARITPEAFVVLPDGTIAYRGRISDLFAALGQKRGEVRSEDLRRALEAVRDGAPVAVVRTEAVGCYVPALPQRD